MINFYFYYTIGRKVLMALSGFFLMVFLLQHLVINLLSVISPNLFNQASHFMGTNTFVQYILQPVLIGGFFFHLIMGMVLDFKNRNASSTKYAFNDRNNSTWVSRNMIITGTMIFLFICLHFYDFWIPEINTKFIQGDWSGMHHGEFRYFAELQHKFVDLWRVLLYNLSFIFLSLHLLHGFQSSFQSVGVRNKTVTPLIKKVSYLYAILVPAGFVFIALYHYIVQVIL
mgnify:FL=1|tara:strand:+ start:137 stop:820 length:684 start_codon:yes stop_codon:yes gene_type:complete